MKLKIWPDHCIVGTKGHEVIPKIDDALQKWVKHKNVSVEYLERGQNLRTEMYSVLSALVVDTNDPTTRFNEKLMSQLNISDKVIVCGHARSHVVKYTLQDICKELKGDISSRLCVLEDGCTGFETDGQELSEDMRKLGVTVIKAKDVFPNGPDKSDDKTLKLKHAMKLLDELLSAEKVYTNIKHT